MARLDAANARVGARRARAPGPAELRELLARPTTEARLELLAHAPWGPALPDALARAPDPLGAVEAALRDGLRGEAASILESVEGARPRTLLVAWLDLEAAAAVKVIVRGIAAGEASDRIAALAPPAPSLPQERIRALAAAPSVEAVVGALAAWGSPLAPALREALPTRARHGLLPLEVAADRAALAWAREACRRGGEDGRILAAHLADRVDARNAATLLALAGSGGGDLFLAGGLRLSAEEFGRLAAAGEAALRAGLARAFPGTDAALARPWSADLALEHGLAARLRREARRSPLSLAVPLAYLTERRAQARRIAVLLRAAALGLPGEEILDLVEG
jgi:V/A-type H+/Na+-transporting ATPase subunit C